MDAMAAFAELESAAPPIAAVLPGAHRGHRPLPDRPRPAADGWPRVSPVGGVPLRRPPLHRQHAQRRQGTRPAARPPLLPHHAPGRQGRPGRRGQALLPGPRDRRRRRVGARCARRSSTSRGFDMGEPGGSHLVRPTTSTAPPGSASRATRAGAPAAGPRRVASANASARSPGRVRGRLSQRLCTKMTAW